MNLSPFHLASSLRVLRRVLATQFREEQRRQSIQSRFVGVHIEWPTTFLVDDWSAVFIEPDAYIGPYSEIVSLASSPCSSVSGGLRIGRGARLGMGTNIRAAGGLISIGRDTQIGQHVNLIGSNHLLDRATNTVDPIHWDPLKTGVIIGEGCWIGAGVTILPGVVIGSGCVIGAGSVVTKSMGKNHLCLGLPARATPPSA